MSKKIICFTGGGSGGHVYPAKPIIDSYAETLDLDQIFWIGSRDGIEKEIVAKWNIQYRGISSGKLRRYFSVKNFFDIFRIVTGFFQARKLLKKIRPAFLYSKGGFVSVPPVYAAHSLKIPVYSHDSDMDPGLATKLNSRKSRRIFIPYKESLKHYVSWKNKTMVSGNPVRAEFFNGHAEKGKSLIGYTGDKPILLIVGGSLGAKEINDALTPLIPVLVRHFFVVHQTGREYEAPESIKGYLPMEYIHEALPHIMKAASLALSRAGAGFLWELAATETPMLLWPLTVGSRGDQPKNAAWFEKRNLARVVNSENLTSEGLLDMLIECSPGNTAGDEMAESMKKHPLPNGTEFIFNAIEEDLEC